MATVISTNGRKKIKSLQNEFNEKFSNLKIEFSTKPIPDDYIRRDEMVDNNKSLSEVRTKKGSGEISINGRKHAGSLESEFQNIFGLYTNVYRWCKNDDGTHYWVPTSATDDWSLSKQNEWSKSHTTESPKKDW